MSADDSKPSERSLSRGRDSVVSSFGRGGFGNMRPSSTSRGPDDRDSSMERGRGANRTLPTDGIDPVPENPIPHSTGRGGYANITDLQSPDIEPPIHITHPDDERVSTGRGGAGNIRDRSQSKVRDHPEPHVRRPAKEGEIFSSGRGGVGNIRARSLSKPPGDEKVPDHRFGIESVLQKVIHPSS